MKNYILVFSLLMGVNVFAMDSKGEQQNQIINTCHKHDFDRFRANEWRKMNIIAGISNYPQKNVRYPKNRTQKRGRRRSAEF